MAVPVAAIIAGVQLGVGLLQKRSGNRRAKKNIRPTADLSEQYEDLLTTLYSEAQYGIDANALAFATEKNQNAFGAALSTIEKTGGSPNDAMGAYSQLLESNNQLAIANSDRRWQKINALAGGTQLLRESNKEEFLYNEDAPYKDTAQAAALQQAEGMKNIFGAIDTAAAAYTLDEGDNPYDDDQQKAIADEKRAGRQARWARKRARAKVGKK